MLNRRVIRWVGRAVATVLLVGAVAVAALLLDGFSDEVERADVGLVLGNTVHPNGTPSHRLQARLERTLELYRADWFPLIIASGGLGREGHDEAVVMRDWLVARGVPAENIIVDRQGLTTFSSAVNTRQLLRERGLNSVLVVTQYFHVPRSKLALRRVGVPTVYSAHARFFEPRDLYSIPREIAGYVSYSFKDAPVPSGD